MKKIKKSVVKKTVKRVHRKNGEHNMIDCGGIRKCKTCGANEDEAFTGGEDCSYVH